MKKFEDKFHVSIMVCRTYIIFSLHEIHNEVIFKFKLLNLFENATFRPFINKADLEELLAQLCSEGLY